MMTNETKWARIALEKQSGDEWWFGGNNGMQIVLFPEGQPEYNSFAVLSGEDEDKAQRLAACWNALAGIPDPAAFVQTARGMAEALERGLNFIANTEDELGITMESGDLMRTALTAFRAASGEQS